VDRTLDNLVARLTLEEEVKDDDQRGGKRSL
jgi:hypothetical protein